VREVRELKIAVLGSNSEHSSKLIRSLTDNAINVEFNGMSNGIDIGYTNTKRRRIYLFGAHSKERERFFEEVLPAGIDLGIVVVESSKGISEDDRELIRELKDRNLPCMVLLYDKSRREPELYGEHIIQGSAENRRSAVKLLEFLSKVT